MRIYIHRAKKTKAGERPQVNYLMVTMTPDEALLLAESLVRQVRTDDPNTGRPETLVFEGDFKGYVSHSVRHERCLQCGKEVAHSGKLQKGGILCGAHETYRQREERERQERLEASWEASRKKKKKRVEER